MRVLQFSYLFVLIVLLSACSLLKFNPEFGTEPLPKSDLNTRMAVRSYYNSFTGKVVQTADSIIASTDDVQILSEAIKWKIGATSACAHTAFQSEAEISLIDTWLLTRQMDEYLKGAGSTIFGDYTSLAQQCAAELYQQIDKVASTTNEKEHYQKLASFVKEQPLAAELYEWHFARLDTRPLLISHLEVADSSYTTTIGTGAEVMNDFTDRISVYNDQIKSQLRWEKDLILINLDNDSIAAPYLARIDSLSLMLNRLAIVAQESPEMLGIIAVRMREELTPVIYDFNAGMAANLAILTREREYLQTYLDEQRVLIREDIQVSGKLLIEETTNNLIRFIRKVSWLIILLVIVLVAVFFGIPFSAGYFLAKARFKTKVDKINSETKN